MLSRFPLLGIEIRAVLALAVIVLFLLLSTLLSVFCSLLRFFALVSRFLLLRVAGFFSSPLYRFKGFDLTF